MSVTDLIKAVTELNAEDWRAFAEAYTVEWNRRQAVDNFDRDLSDLLRKYQAATGTLKGVGAPYRQPAHAGAAYKPGDVARFEGKYYAALKPMTVYSPTQAPSDWRELTSEEVAAGGFDKPVEVEAVTWKPGLELKVGDLVEYGGVFYRVIQQHLTQANWQPDLVAALFERAT